MIFAIFALLIIHTGATVIHYGLTGDQPAVTTALSAGITASDNVIPVSSVEGYPSDGWIFVGGEVITYTNHETPCATAPQVGQPACFTGAIRGTQQTTAISHAIGSRVYNEYLGANNELIQVEQRTSIDALGDVTTPWGAGQAIVRFITNNSTWDWLFCFGDVAPLCIVGQMITIALNMGIFIALAGLLIGAVGLVRSVF